MVSEFVTNAVVHGGGSIALELQHHDGCLRVSVIDAAPLGTGTFRPTGRPTGRPAGRSAGDEEESGRGLAIVAALAARWGSQPGSDRSPCGSCSGCDRADRHRRLRDLAAAAALHGLDLFRGATQVVFGVGPCRRA